MAGTDVRSAKKEKERLVHMSFTYAMYLMGKLEWIYGSRTTAKERNKGGMQRSRGNRTRRNQQR